MTKKQHKVLQKELEALLDKSTPKEIRETLTHLFFSYLYTLKEIPNDFQDSAFVFSTLINFCERIEGIFQSKVQ